MQANTDIQFWHYTFQLPLHLYHATPVASFLPYIEKLLITNYKLLICFSGQCVSFRLDQDVLRNSHEVK